MPNTRENPNRIGIRIKLPDGINTSLQQLPDGSLVFIPLQTAYKLEVSVEAVRYEKDATGAIVVYPDPVDERIISVRPWYKLGRRALRVKSAKEKA